MKQPSELLETPEFVILTGQSAAKLLEKEEGSTTIESIVQEKNLYK